MVRIKTQGIITRELATTMTGLKKKLASCVDTLLKGSKEGLYQRVAEERTAGLSLLLEPDDVLLAVPGLLTANLRTPNGKGYPIVDIGSRAARVSNFESRIENASEGKKLVEPQASCLRNRFQWDGGSWGSQPGVCPSIPTRGPTPLGFLR